MKHKQDLVKGTYGYFDWLKDVLERIPMNKANKLDELLPQNWKKQKDNKTPY